MAQLHFGEGGGNPEGDRDVTARSSRALITCCYSTVPKSEQTLFYCLFFFHLFEGISFKVLYPNVVPISLLDFMENSKETTG